MITKYYIFISLTLLFSYTIAKILNEDNGKQRVPEKDIDYKSLEINVNKILNLLERKIPAIEHDIIRISEMFSKNKNKELERDVNIKSDEIKKMTDLYGTINSKLDNMDEKISKKIEEIHLKFDEMGQNISMKLEENIKTKPKVLNNATGVEMNNTLESYAKENKLSGILFNVTHTNVSAVMEKTHENIMLRLGNEVLVSRIKLAKTFTMESEILKHVTVMRNSTDLLPYLEMHFAIEGDECLGIQLSDMENISDSDITYNIDVGRNNNQFTVLQYKSRTLRRIHTPDILSSTEIRTFYIKVDDGKLEFGKENSSFPLLSYHDGRFKLVNYFTIGNWYTEGKNHYNCSAPVEELPCKEETLVSNHRDTAPYSMDSEALNHVTLLRNFTGHLAYFETHIAIEAGGEVCIRLSGTGSDSHSDIRHHIHVGWESNQYTILESCSHTECTTVQRVHTPDILSPTQFKAFYIKINNGKLDFGKEGRRPLISHDDTSFSSVNFFTFDNWVNEAKIRYDCPAPVEELPLKEWSEECPCKNVSVSSRHHFSKPYSMDSATLNHVTLKRTPGGHLTYFEMNVAIQADGYVVIRLSDIGSESYSEIYVNIDVGFEGNTRFDIIIHGKTTPGPEEIATPNILSSTQFRTFNIKIDGGKLQISKEGGSSPLISHYDDRFRLLKYFLFYNGDGNKAKFRFDCPTPVSLEGSS